MEWFDPTRDDWARAPVVCSLEGCNEVMTPAAARWAIDYTAADPVQRPFCSLRCRTRWRVQREPELLRLGVDRDREAGRERA